MRADKFFAEKFGSRTKAAEAIEKGLVLVNGRAIRTKDEVSETDAIQLITPKVQYVSNGGYKLHRAITCFAFSCEGKVFADIGASTGGFTDCLLQNGARRVYAIDVGESLLHDSLAEDKRIVRMENTNARYLTSTDFPERLDGIVTDVSFISLRLIFPAVTQIIDEEGFIVALIKPQFECENKKIGKSGIVHTSAHVDIITKVCGYAADSQLYVHDIVNAPVRKGKNIEYVVLLKKKVENSLRMSDIQRRVRTFLKKQVWPNFDDKMEE